MKKIRSHFLIIASLLLIVSCDKFVDIQPKGQIIPTTLDDIRLILDNSSPFYTRAHLIYQDDDLQLISTDVNTFYNTSYNKANALVYAFEDYFAEVDEFDYHYNDLYKAVGFANQVLTELEGVPNTDQDFYNDLKGEALFYRAYAYFTLLNAYAPQMTDANANTAELGIPLIPVEEFANTSYELTRSSLQETYDLIINDLKEAAGLMYDGLKRWNFMPTKAAAFGMLARVYLQIGDMENAKSYATQALAIKSDLLDYRVDDNIGSQVYDWWTGTYVFSPGIPFKVKDHPEAILSMESSAPYYYDYSTWSFVYLTRVSEELLAKFDQSNDIRYTKLINPSTRSYQGFNNGYGLNFGVKTPELYLIRAEATARLNQLQAAKDDIITLLTYRYLDGTVPDFAGLTTQQEVIDMVIDERRKELMFMGHRFFDIKRLNALYNANIGISHVDWDGNTRTLNANDAKWVWPFPKDVIAKNPEIAQNPRQ